MKGWYTDDQFIMALGELLQVEQGFVEDHAGRTVFGITERDWPELWEGGAPTLEEAADVYYEDYWRAAGCPRVRHPAVARELFNSAVLEGPGTAIRHLQKGINTLLPPDEQIVVDGRFGPQTMHAVNDYPNARALVGYQNAHQASRIIELIQDDPEKYLKYAAGWARRFAKDPFPD